MTKVVYTHKGWIGVCPVYFGGLDADGPYVAVRHWTLEWLLDLSEAVLGAGMWLRAQLDEDYEPAFPLLITGELADPIVRDYPEEA